MKTPISSTQEHKKSRKAPMVARYLPDIFLTLMRSHLNEIESFYNDIESHYVRKLGKLDQEYARHPESYWKEEMNFGMTREDMLADEYQDIKSLQALNRDFGVLGVYAAFERLLFRVFSTAKHLGLLPGYEGKENLQFKDYIKVMKKHLAIDLRAHPGTYRALNELREIRNAIVHHEGRVTRENIYRLRPYGFEEEGPIEVSPDYIPHIKDVVYSTGETVLKQLTRFLGKNGLM
jgi:hypothetical protein